MDDLETRIRDTLRERHDDITTAPALDLALQDRRRPRWIAGVAAAAAVAAVAVVITVLPSAHHAPPAGRGSPSPRITSPNPSPSPSPVVPQSCRTTLPRAWQQAFVGGQLDLGGIGAAPSSVTADGTIVAVRDGGFTPGSPRDVLLLRPGKPAQPVYQVPDPDQLVVQSADLVGDKLVVALMESGRPPRGEEPGDSPLPNIRKLVVVDLRTGQQHVVASMSGPNDRPFIDASIVLDGRVYWDERASFTSDRGVIKSYGLHAGDVRSEYSGKVIEFATYSPAGIGDGTDVYVRATLPAPVAAGLDSKHPLLVTTDGSAYAWQIGAHEIGWWAPGQSRPSYVRVPEKLDDNYAGELVVSGHFVFTVNGTMIDVRTGAEAPIAGGKIPTGKFFDPAATAGGGIVAGANSVGEGHFQNGYWEDPQPRVLRVNTAHLPDLHC